MGAIGLAFLRPNVYQTDLLSDHGGDTALILTDPSGNETVYDLHIEYSRFDIVLH